ncbi:MAG: hypothetical protein M1819_002275 [Sarea resinae]|nr:MAG: hypothetical protein M1819_002275 [Sarea resinae]
MSTTRVIAVAGGTGDVGRAIVDALKAQAGNGLQVVVLSRKSTLELEQKIGAPILAVDYNSVPSLAHVLESNNIHTVISTLAILGPEQGAAQLNLIRAAQKSSVTKRFAPSEWGMFYNHEQTSIFPFVTPKLQAVAELKQNTSLEYTLFHTGFFLDYWGMPKVPSYLKPMTLIFDIPHATAAIPGTGDTPVVLSHTFDVAKFVAARLAQADGAWTEHSVIIGDKVTLNQFLALAEAATGKKFSVSYDPLETLQQGRVTELPSHKLRYPVFPKEKLQGLHSVFGRVFQAGDFDLKEEGSLNQKFPEIKTRSVKEVLVEAWGSK